MDEVDRLRSDRTGWKIVLDNTPSDLLTSTLVEPNRRSVVERINQFSVWELGKCFQEVSGLSTENTVVASSFFTLWKLRQQCKQMEAGKPFPLHFSKSRLSALQSKLNEIEREYYFTTDEEGKREFSPWECQTTIPNWTMSSLKTAISEFEIVFAEEMRDAATYFVPKKGIFATDSLVNAADESFPSEIAECIPAKSRTDWKAAGRCLAFNLLSASGFHVTRAVEGMLEVYYQHFSGKAGETLRGWHDYIQALREIAGKQLPVVPSQKTIAELDQMRSDYRNPIAHPRVVLSEPDARMLFANGESLIIAMAQELSAVKGIAQPSLTLVAS